MRVPAMVLFAAIGGCVEYESHSNVDPNLGVDDGAGPPDPADVPEGSWLDAYDLPPADVIDVIVYGDTSSSMQEELQTMGSVVREFVDRLAENVSDWQLAAVTGNTGCAVNGILTPATPAFEDLFADGIVTPPADTDEDEMAFQNTAIAVEQSGPGQCNDGLVRGDLLYLVYVSDENDESPGFDSGDADYWRGYYDRIAAIHGNPAAIVMSAVAGPVPLGCIGADPGQGYDRAVAATGGEFLSICTDWASKIDLLADAGTIRDHFPLTDVPDPATIEVWVDAVARPAGDWEYRPAGNEVVFVANPPHPGDKVDILYAIAGR
ncbi:MAG: hypothetical protein ABMB14_08590 [Myxococcota bacterium]